MRRCLVLTNLYPPHHIGGYELGCRDLVEGLTRLGWEVRVLTGNRVRPDTPAVDEPRVERSLRYLWDLPREASPFRVAGWVWSDLRTLRACISSHRPDHILVFNTWGLNKCLLAELAAGGIPFTLLVSDMGLPSGLQKDAWFAFWSQRPRVRSRHVLKSAVRLAVRMAGLRPDPPESRRLMRSCVFTSDFLLRHHCAQNLVPGRGVVLHWGVESSAIPRRPTVRPFAGKFVFAGQLRHDKGVHTAIAAALELRRRGIAGFHLDCYGNSDDTGYVAQLHRTIEEGGLREWVSLRGELSRDVLLSRYSDYDVLVFPSVWDEPFSIGLIEGMAAGLAVLATPTGGTPEILHDGRNALLFPADDALRLADRMTELITDPARVRDLAEAAYRTVVPVFTMDQMAAALSTYLAGEKGGA